MLMSVPHGLPDDVGRLSRPDEGRGMRVPLVDVALDMPDEKARTVSKEPRRTDLRVRMLNHASTIVQPRGPLRPAGEPNVRVSHQPTLDRSRGVRSCRE